VVAGLVTAVGWVVTYVLSGRSERRRRRDDALLAHTERQLEELYGPLAFLVIEGKQTFRDLLASLGRKHVFGADGEISDEDLKTWLFWVDNDLLPRNDKIKRILMAKTHLIEGGEVSPDTIAFLDHHNSWKINHLRWKTEGVPYSWHSKVEWPRQFEDEILATFRLLKARYATILGRTVGSAGEQ
jgi:hypothetical protein